jgi:hypothetical protein
MVSLNFATQCPDDAKQVKRMRPEDLGIGKLF